jgi:hypothetical protein
MRSAVMLLLLGGIAVVAAGCGGSASPSPAALRLERQDLAVVGRALEDSESSVGSEVAAARRAWPLVANGLPSDATAISSLPIAAAAHSARRVKVPLPLQEAQAVSLTGPGAQLAGLFGTYAALATRGWSLIVAAIEEIKRGSPASARFARENVALYIESVYDGHFTLAQIGKKLLDGYRKLGGPAAFGAALTRREVDALARTYSEATDRLHPHVGVRLGS